VSASAPPCLCRIHIFDHEDYLEIAVVLFVAKVAFRECDVHITCTILGLLANNLTLAEGAINVSTVASPWCLLIIQLPSYPSED
jgi:hypothetical protein